MHNKDLQSAAKQLIEDVIRNLSIQTPNSPSRRVPPQIQPIIYPVAQRVYTTPHSVQRGTFNTNMVDSQRQAENPEASTSSRRTAHLLYDPTRGQIHSYANSPVTSTNDLHQEPSPTRYSNYNSGLLKRLGHYDGALIRDASESTQNRPNLSRAETYEARPESYHPQQNSKSFIGGEYSLQLDNLQWKPVIEPPKQNVKPYSNIGHPLKSRFKPTFRCHPLTQVNKSQATRPQGPKVIAVQKPQTGPVRASFYHSRTSSWFDERPQLGAEKKGNITAIESSKIQSAQLFEPFDPIYSRDDLRQEWQNNFYSDRNEYNSALQQEYISRADVNSRHGSPQYVIQSPKSTNIVSLSTSKDYSAVRHMATPAASRETIQSGSQPTRLFLRDQEFPISTFAQRHQRDLSTTPLTEMPKYHSIPPSQTYTVNRGALNNSEIRTSNYSGIQERGSQAQDHRIDRFSTADALGHLSGRRSTEQQLEFRSTNYAISLASANIRPIQTILNQRSVITAPPPSSGTLLEESLIGDSERRSPPPLRLTLDAYSRQTEHQIENQQRVTFNALNSSNYSRSPQRMMQEQANIQFNISTVSSNLQKLLSSVNPQSSSLGNSGIFEEIQNKDRPSMPSKLSQMAKQETSLTVNNKYQRKGQMNKSEFQNSLKSKERKNFKREPFHYKPMLKLADTLWAKPIIKDQHSSKQTQRPAIDSTKQLISNKHIKS